jgi:proteic killer suppression protein
MQQKGLEACNVTVYNRQMIKTFRHKGLKLLFEEDEGKKLPPDLVGRIRIILSTLHAAQEIEGMNLPTFRLHQLKGDLKRYYSVTVRSNWRIIFSFEDGNAFDVDFVDYH